MRRDKRYVRLVLTGLRTVLAHENRQLEHWDLYLDTVVFAINNRILRVHGFTPLQLFVGMSPRSRVEDITVRDETVGALLAGKKFDEEVGRWHVWMSVAEREERHELARESILDEQERQIEARQRELEQRRAEVWQPRAGDLVLLRRFAVNKDKGRKLEPKWEGPYRISKVTKSGVSVWLEDVCTGGKKGRYSVDDIKIYLVREHGVAQEGYNRVGGIHRRGERQQEVARVQLQAEWRGRDV